MESHFILKSLKKKFKHNQMQLIESYVYREESDFLTFDVKDFTHEIEVKVSRSDFKADFKKEKHSAISNLMVGKTMLTRRGSEYGATQSILGILKHYSSCKSLGREYKPSIRSGVSEWYSTVYIHEIHAKNYPNKFSFCVPEGLVQPEEIPEYYGLYWISEDGVITEKKRAKYIHKEKFSDWKYLARKLYFHASKHH